MKLERFLQVIDNMGKWSGQVIAPLALVYMAILIYEIVVRYVFNSPTMWAHETSALIFGIQFMLGGAYCFWRGSMVNVEILHDRLPKRTQAILDSFLVLVPLFMCAVIMWKGGVFAWDSVIELERTQTNFGAPLYPSRVVVPLSAFLLVTQVIAKFVRDLHFAVTGKNLQ